MDVRQTSEIRQLTQSAKSPLNKGVALDRVGIRVFETPRSLRPARQLNAVVRRHRSKHGFELLHFTHKPLKPRVEHPQVTAEDFHEIFEPILLRILRERRAIGR